MNLPALIFDLDGTLTDSGEGVTKCARLALESFGIPVTDLTSLRYFVGPPLRVSFLQAGIPEENIEGAVAKFRSRYNVVGKYENVPYEGIHQLLRELGQAGYRLYVGTSKPEKTAMDVLNKFELTPYFHTICGSDFEGLREDKDDVLRTLLQSLPAGQKAVMIGDTIYDVEGAKTLGLPTIGVSWGYGEVEEMRRAGAIAIVDTMEQLRNLLLAPAFQEQYG